MDKFERDLDCLFADYRRSLPDREPAADFMPKVWQRIEARRSVTVRIQRLARVFLTAAVALGVTLTAVVYTQEPSPAAHATYADALVAAHPLETTAALDVLHHSEPGEPDNR